MIISRVLSIKRDGSSFLNRKENKKENKKEKKKKSGGGNQVDWFEGFGGSGWKDRIVSVERVFENLEGGFFFEVSLKIQLERKAKEMLINRETEEKEDEEEEQEQEQD